MSSIPEFDEKQLAAARATAWHQNAEPILTLDAARTWVTERGIVLFAPRPSQLPVPAPSLVEATLGAANPAPTAAQTDIARGLVSRMVADGVAIPLNLLGIPGDIPDFVVSAQVFSYIFTLRGDKAWKLPPQTSGAIAVSPLGLHIYEVLAEKGALTAAELANELGREVTETAILRSLTELWSQLRVLPLLQAGTGVTLWELTTRRFTKAIKAGANAGQPKALSALTSLYLAQVFAATEDEIQTFLSPLTARSRVREVVNALVGARQLETVTVEGKTLLHIPGALPAFAPNAAEVTEDGEEVAAPIEKPKKIGTGRISSFTSEKKVVGELRGKPVRAFAAGAKPAGRPSKYAPRLDGKSDPERRPFKKDGGFGAKPTTRKPAGKPAFDKPWEEEKKPRAAAVKDGFTKFRRPEPEDRKPLGPREQAGLPEERRTPSNKSVDRATKSFERKPYAAKTFGDKPAFAAKRPYTPRSTEDGERPTFKPRSYEKREGGNKPYASKPAFGSKPSFGSKPAFGSKPNFGARKPYAARNPEGVERPAAKRPYTPRTEGSATPYAAKRPYTPRTSEDGERPAYKPRTFDGAAKPSFGAKRPYTRATDGEAKPFTKRPFNGGKSEGTGRPFVKREAPKRLPKARFTDADAAAMPPVERTLAKRPHKPRAADHDKRPFNKDPWVPPTDSGEGKRPFKSKGSFGRSGAGPRKTFGKKPGGFGAGASRPSSRKKPV